MNLSPRRLQLVLGAVFLAVILFVVPLGSRRSVTTDARRRAAVATHQLDSLVASRSDSVPAIALGYVERARLGLGSPFRLVDQVVHDRRLGDSARIITAWAILDRVFAGATHQVDPRVLDAIGPEGAGRIHLSLIERVIDDALDPRAAETALRLAYQLAHAEGTLSMTASVPTVVEVIAQVRDRELARRDLRRAVPRATVDGVDVLEELIHLRETRELDVEAPLLSAALASRDGDAIDKVPSILEEIRAIGPGLPDSVSPRAATVLAPSHASILTRVAGWLPPLSAARVTVQTRAGSVRADSSLSALARRALLTASNEEELVGAFAFAQHSSGTGSVAAARLMLSVGVALRAHAQDRVWFPGDQAPTAATVAGRHGLKAIVFDDDVRPSWRPFYVQMLGSSIEDLARVLPGYDVRGLTVRFSAAALPDSALAMHDPRTRTLRLSTATGSGTLAHEFAHDVDWLAARRLFATRGGYATDRSLNEQQMSLSSAVRGLTSARAVGRGRPTLSSRPAEVFARSVDWFVADALAQGGRSNGFLTAIVDPMLSGIASTTADAASLSGAGAIVRSLRGMTYLPDSLATGYRSRWETLDALEPAHVVQRVLETSPSPRRLRTSPFMLPSPVAAELLAAPACILDRLHDGTQTQRLIAMTIEARARGANIWRARSFATANRPAWARAVLGEAPYAAGAARELQARTLASYVEGAARAGLVELPPAPFATTCGTR